MIRNSFITMMLALVAMTGLAQTTKTITITDSSPALKDGTLMLAGVGVSGTVVDTVQSGRFASRYQLKNLPTVFSL